MILRSKGKQFRIGSRSQEKRLLKQMFLAALPELGTQGGEHIALSSKAKDIQKSHEAVKNSSDIRVDKVDRIKTAISEGSFHVDSHELAEKILKDVIVESKFLE